MTDRFVQIEYWIQDTIESGRWVTTPPMLYSIADMILSRYERGTIVEMKTLGELEAESTDGFRNPESN
jgi:hypothetical protein